MKLNTLVAVALSGFLATSFVYAAPTFTKVDDTNSTTMQQMPSDVATTPSNDADAVVPGPMADANSSNNANSNIGAIPPSSMPSSADNSNSTQSNGMDPQSASNNMDPQGVNAASGDSDMSADTATGDDDY